MVNNILDFKIYETRQEAESFLKRNGKDSTDPSYIKIKNISINTPSLLGILTKLHYDKNISIDKISEILNLIDKYRNDLRRDKINPQTLLTDSYKEVNSLEYIEDILDLVEIKN